MHTRSMSLTRLMIASAAAFLCAIALSSPGAAQAPKRAAFAIVDSTNPPNEALAEYIRSVRFLSDHVSGDERMLDAAHTNVIIRIEPAAGNHLVTESLLKTAGRIMARLVNRGTDSVSRFALAPSGKTYLWVQHVGGTLRGVLISTDSTGLILRRVPIRLTPDSTDHPGSAKQSLARLRTDSIGKVLAACVPGCVRGWCKGDTTATAVW